MATTPQEQRDLKSFEEELAAPPERFSLFTSALLVASIVYPTMEPGWQKRYQRQLHEIVSDARDFMGSPPPLTPRVAVKRLAVFLRDIQGFQGDLNDYASPKNSCLNDVLRRRRGLPISLAVLFVSIGQRLGLNIFGVGAPGHFLTGVKIADKEIVYIDLFNDTELMSEDEASERVGSHMGQDPEDIRPYLVPMAPRKILYRMLNNLKLTYRNRGDFDRLIRISSWMLALDPENGEELRGRGLLRLRIGEVKDGAQDLLVYLEKAPDDSPDREIIRQEALRAIADRAELN